MSVLYEYLPNGKLYKTTYPDGNYITHTYDRSWRVIRTTDQDNKSIAYTYDKKGNLLSVSDSMGNTSKNEYDEHSRLIKAIDVKGNETTYRYDANSNCIETTNALGLVTSFDYDAMNRLVKVTTHAKAGDLSVSYKYNAIGQVIETNDEEGHSIHVEYDVLGNVTTLTDALGNVVNKNTYNALNQLKTSEDALGVQTQYQYSSMGDVTEVIECLNTAATKKTTMNYDSSGRLMSVVDPMDQTSSATYDNVGFVKTVTDASGGTTTYNYDDINRLIETVNAIGAKETYTYNSKGLIEETTNSRNQKTQYTYDVLGRIKALKDEEGTIEYTYDASGNITNVKDKNGTTERTFDALNRVTSITDHNGRTIQYGYDELGNRISLTYPGGEIVRYTYTKTGNLATVTDPDHRKTYYDYDANGRLIQTLRPDGSVEKRSYDAKGQLTKISDQIGSKILLQDSFTYDEAGNITKITKAQDEYADISKLTDALMTYDAQNRMLTYNGETIEYDADGNMTYGPLAGVMTKFTYDCRNRLVQAGDYHYEYNSENVRISAQNKETKWSYLVDPQATYSQILITETYEKNLLGQFTKLTGSTLYTYGLGLISESSEKSGYLVYHFDQLGSTKRITDKDGKTVYTMNYGSYGELFGIKDAKGNLVNFKDNPIAFLYNGQYGIVTDQNTLTYMRARYYNSEIKRFINQDVLTGSIGNSQSLNRYSYVQGNPIRFTDPFGLCPNGSGTLSEFTPATKFILGLAHAAYAYNYEMTWQEQTHIACAVLGLVPGVGNIADFVDAKVYTSEGNYAEAAYSGVCLAAGIVPGAEQAAAVGKLLRVFDNVFGGAKAAKKIAKTRSLIKISGNIEDFAGIGREGSYLFDLAKGTQIVNKAADGAKVASHAADGIKAADNSIDVVRSSSNIGEAIPHTSTFAACFTADTKIKTKDGSKNISDIKVGDEVYSENPETGETGYQKVAQVFVVKTNTILTIKTQNETIETTKPHPFYVIGKGFVAAKDLQVGDHLKMANGEEAIIESLTLKHCKDPVTVYNFEVENWHTYHVSGSEVLVHNVALNPCAMGGSNSVPNPNGKKGGTAHQRVIKEIKQDANGRGLSFDTEFRYDTSGGFKNSRYADVVIFDSQGRVMEIHQVGRTTKKHGAPVSRERKAIRDIRSSKDYNGAKIIYHPYDE